MIDATIKTRVFFRRISGNWKALLSVFLLIIIISTALVLRLHNIAIALPYPQHTDESQIAITAGRILRTGDLNPHYFRYPSLPIYLTAAGFAVGFLDAAAHHEVSKVDEIGSVSYPYFTHPRVVLPAKWIFTLLSVLSMAFMGIVAYRAYNHIFLLFLVPFIILLSDIYFLYSQKYLNVDIVGTFFISSLYLYQYVYYRKDSYLHKSVIPGVISGMVIASKYSLFWIMAPSMLIIWLFSTKRRPSKIVLLVVIMFISFLLVVPYSVLDFKTFLNDVRAEVYHYAQGYAVKEETSAPGLSQFIHYLKSITEDFGSMTIIFFLIGMGSSFYKNWKHTLILLSFPFLLLLYMSAQKVFFVRNILFLFTFYAMFAAIGLISLYSILSKLLEYISLFKNSIKLKHSVVTIAVIVLAVLFLPLKKPVAFAKTKPDTRNLATKWVNENIEKGAVLVIPKELSMDSEPLERDYRLVIRSFRDLSLKNFRTLMASLGHPYVLMPFFGYTEWRLKGKEKVAERLNKFRETIDVLKTFPGRAVVMNHQYPVPSGNIKLSIGSFRSE